MQNKPTCRGNYSRQKLNPIELMKSLGWEIKHITFNPGLKQGDADIYIGRGSTHDSTMCFTLENLQRCLIPVANNQTYCKKHTIDFERLKHIEYEIGYVKIATVFGLVNIPAGRFPGQKERIRMSVKCKYVY